MIVPVLVLPWEDRSGGCGRCGTGRLVMVMDGCWDPDGAVLKNRESWDRLFVVGVNVRWI